MAKGRIFPLLERQNKFADRLTDSDKLRNATLGLAETYECKSRSDVVSNVAELSMGVSDSAILSIQHVAMRIENKRPDIARTARSPAVYGEIAFQDKMDLKCDLQFAKTHKRDNSFEPPF